LRFLAYKLELDERQVAGLARVLDELKTERAQGEVDRRRSLTAFADAVGAEAFDEARAKEAGTLRVSSAERLRDAVTKALGQIHALLDADQRERLAYLSLADFIPGVEPYESATVVELEAGSQGVRLAMTVEPMHDDVWTGRLVKGRENELDNLARLIG